MKKLEDYLYYEEKNPDLRIYLGDCLEILPLLPKVDLVVTDPPYGVKENYAEFDDTPENTLKITTKAIDFCVNRWLTVMTPGVKNMFAYKKPSHVGAFYYPAASGCNVWGFSCWQPIFYYGKDPYAGKGSYADSFTSTECAEKWIKHPCPKPIMQWKKLLNRVSLKDQIVLDPFLGSGTTLVACKELNRNGIGIEISEKYCAIAKQRLKATTKSLF